jgi:RND family efflux transporter MFP subunit
VFAALVLAACRGDAGEASARPEAAPPPVRLAPENVAVVEVRELEDGPQVSGTLQARRSAALRAEVGGAVTELRVDPGQRVRAGDVLLRIDAPALRDAALAAASSLRASRNALEVAAANARRAETLAKAGAMSAQEAESARAQLQAARAQVEDARARRAQARETAGKVVVRAPFDGVVATRPVSRGDVVGVGTLLATIVDPSTLELVGAIPAARLGGVRPGAAVDFTVTGFDRAYAGTIDRVNPAVDPATGQVLVYVEVPNHGGELVAGLYAQGRIATRAEAVPAAPASVVDASTQPPTVLKIEGQRVRKVPVKVRLRDPVAGQVGFEDGVAPGDLLVLGSARADVAEGTAVEVPREQATRSPTGEAAAGTGADAP